MFTAWDADTMILAAKIVLVAGVVGAAVAAAFEFLPVRLSVLVMVGASSLLPLVVSVEKPENAGVLRALGALGIAALVLLAVLWR